jgi:hypothetical protein
MNHISAGLILTVLLGHAGAFAQDAPVTSTRERGVVSVQAEPALSDGRLLLKVVAFNRTKEPASFGPQNVVMTTASGQPVELLTLEQLVKEARAASGRSARVEHNPGSYSGPAISHDSAGKPDVGNYTGSNAAMSGGISSQTQAATAVGGVEDKGLQQQIASLEAAVLQPVTIAPGAAAGGQVVTEKLKLKRKDDRTILVAVDLNGEHHELEVMAPRSGK